MKTSDITRRLADLGGAKWQIYQQARDLVGQGVDVIEMTIGEPDVPVPAELLQVATQAMMAGRTTYSDGRGEVGLRQALARHYTVRTGRNIVPDQVMCFPGTQTALFATMLGVAQAGDQVLVGDPMYATYQGIIRASGAEVVPVPLHPQSGFRLQAHDLAEHITPQTRAILLTTPHNPTGAILSREDIRAIGALAVSHDLWIISDEVYADMIYPGNEFTSPLDDADIADRVIVVSSISKSHAAPGFRSGWCIASREFCNALLPVSETMLFGNQPFIADMTAHAITHGSPVVQGMVDRFYARAQRLAQRLHGASDLRVHVPQAGMFAMVDVSRLNMTGTQFAQNLLDQARVALMPGSSFGDSLEHWVRVALTIDDPQFNAAIDRIITYTSSLQKVG